MVILERRLTGIFRYRKIFSPNAQEAAQISGSMLPNDVVRMFAVATDLGKLPHMVKHQAMLTTYVDLSLALEQILGAMKRKSCRYEIRRAEKMLSTVEIDCNSQRARCDFLPLYNSFAKAKGPVPRLSPRQFRELMSHGDVFVLYQDRRPMCCHLLLRDDGARAVRLLHSGSRRFECSKDAAACGALNRYLHWHSMQQYLAQGIQTYDFGGIRNMTHPTAQFKLSFGGKVMTEHYYFLGGTTWVAKLGGIVYDRCFRSSAPALAGRA